MRIAVHAFDGMTMFHLATPLLVFGEVSRLNLAEDWETQVFTENGLPVRSAEDYVIGRVFGPDIAHDADIVVFPSWLSHFPEPSGDLLQLVRQSHERGAAIAGLCLGAYPVARSGVLDGRTAVTHWAAAPAMAAKHHEVEFDDSALYLDHGDVLTSAGTASALDACLHIVRTRLGSAAAATLARHIVVAPHREGDQAQYIIRPLQDPELDGPLGKTIEWALANLDQDLEVESMAAHATMSKRNFTRRFKEVTGLSPARWVLGRRLDDARQLLETTTWSIARIAESCGFGSPVTFRQNFIAAYSTTPTSYRIRFTSR
ncbi:GlxA family transcriptional regulator [Paenarthrobacter aurescens]|jgi:transcriptional regulator GlxA family with amidase domain|uniref:Transcriptional regulator, AraC family n=1 Tax=Paenarthrobacter aurescens (strain TC1) TaxID=290340 RepID=A1RDN9_PAEAT|nr:helix-turn-helix domain-containing protein [Paenarthrobacter aurescens]ABM10694.1 transcriptional regulator, AraC family [Paenarthrobacter aurescens TC1]